MSVPAAVLVLTFLAQTPAPPAMFLRGDANGDGAVDVAAAVSLLSALFLGGAPVDEPRSTGGIDPTADGLSCREYPPCESETLASGYGKLRTIAGKGEDATEGLN